MSANLTIPPSSLYQSHVRGNVSGSNPRDTPPYAFYFFMVAVVLGVLYFVGLLVAL